MKITCDTCQSKYTVSDEKVQGKTVKIKCKKCGSTILVGAGGATTTAGAAAASGGAEVAAAGTAGEAFLVSVGDNDQRTMTLAEVVEAYNASVITAETYIWSDERNDWQTLSEVDAIVAALNASAAVDERAAASVAAPPEAEPAPRAAARRDPGRASQDLFGAGLAQASAPALSAPLFSAPAATPSGVGQRDENSVLFSLSALTAKAGNVPAAPASTASREDSGLIDLKALAASAPAAPAAAASLDLMGDSGGLFPLGAPQLSAPVASTPATVSATAPAASNRTGLFIGIGGIAVALAIVGTFMAMKGGDPAPASAPTSVAVVPLEPTAAPVPTAEPSAEPSAVASAEPSASASASAAPATKPVAKVPGPMPKPAAGSPTPGAKGPAAATAKPTPKKGGGCGCAPGDLMCAMRCSAGGK